MAYQTHRRRLLAGCLLIAAAGGWGFAHRFAAESPDDTEKKPSRESQSAIVTKVAAARETSKNSAARKSAGAATKSTPHTPPNDVMKRLLERLHQDALRHFHADPRFGMLRLPGVIAKIERQWEVPHFSPDELEGNKPLSFGKALDRIHNGTVKDFLTRKPAKKTKKTIRRYPVTRDPKKYDRKKKVWEAKSVDMIGLLTHKYPVAWTASTPHSSKDKDSAKPKKRELDHFEFAALKELESGRNLYARSHKGIVRMLGAIRAKKSCLACHEGKKEGDLFGAFSYTLREAKYERRAGRHRFPLPIGSRR